MNKRVDDLEFNHVKISGCFYDGVDFGGTPSGEVEMCFDVYSKLTPSKTIYANINVDEAKALRDRLDEFIEWAELTGSE